MRTITVKGTGNVSVKPDLIVIIMTLEETNGDYECAMKLVADKARDLGVCLQRIGFEKEALKTTNFNVDKSFDSIRDDNGNYKRVFKGFCCTQALKLEFDFQMERLSSVLQAMAKSYASPEWDIRFTVKDRDGIDEALLKSATKNAKEKALVLCEAAGVQLGNLISIDYCWGELNIYSKTELCLEDRCVGYAPNGLKGMEIEPDDIDLKDTVTFVWEIK